MSPTSGLLQELLLPGTLFSWLLNVGFSFIHWALAKKSPRFRRTGKEEVAELGGELGARPSSGQGAPPTSPPLLGLARTSQQHLLQQVVDLGHAEELDELDLLNHLPGDALQGRQQEQQLAEAASGVVLAVVDVVLQAHLYLRAQPLDLAWVAQPLGICNGRAGVKGPAGASGEPGPRSPLTPEALRGGPSGPRTLAESLAVLGPGFRGLKNQGSLAHL